MSNGQAPHSEGSYQDPAPDIRMFSATFGCAEPGAGNACASAAPGRIGRSAVAPAALRLNGVVSKGRAGRWGLLAGCFVAASVWAQTSERPWTLSATQNLTHESNVLGSVRGSEQSDSVSTTTLAGGLDLPLGRQRAFANASFSHQRYRHLDARNNDGYAMVAGFDGSTIERLAGGIKFNANRRQADFNVGGVTPVSVSNIERSEELAVNLSLGGRGLLGVDVGAGRRQVSFSASEYASQEYAQDSARVGVAVRPSSLLAFSLGLGGDRTRFLAPATGQSAAERSRRRDVYASAVWVPNGLSTVNLRLASSRVQYERSAASDFDGLTGSLAWTWKPSGKLALTTTLTRDTGQESGFLRLSGGNAVSATDFSQLSNSQSLRASYELTAKFSLSVGLTGTQRNFVDGTSGVSSSDRTESVTLGARWAATRTVALVCSGVNEVRASSSTRLPSYTSNRFGCSGQISLD